MLHRMYLVNVQTQVDMSRTTFLEKSCQILFFQYTVSVNIAFKAVISLNETVLYLYINIQSVPRSKHTSSRL